MRRQELNIGRLAVRFPFEAPAAPDAKAGIRGAAGRTWIVGAPQRAFRDAGVIPSPAIGLVAMHVHGALLVRRGASPRPGSRRRLRAGERCGSGHRRSEVPCVLLGDLEVGIEAIAQAVAEKVEGEDEQSRSRGRARERGAARSRGTRGSRRASRPIREREAARRGRENRAPIRQAPPVPPSRLASMMMTLTAFGRICRKRIGTCSCRW